MTTYTVEAPDEPQPIFEVEGIWFVLNIHHFDGTSFTFEPQAIELLIDCEFTGYDDPEYVRDLESWEKVGDTLIFEVTDDDLRYARKITNQK